MRSISLMVLLAACKGGNGNGDDTNATDDSGGPPPTGCVALDDGTTYASVQDAHDRAADGATMDLSGCPSIDEALVVTKSIKIVGPGADLLTWNAPTNHPAIEVNGATGVEISGFSVTSTRDGITGTDASFSVTDVSFLGLAESGVRISGGAVTIDACLFDAPGGGGVEANGGSATVRNSEFLYPLGFAVYGHDGATLTTEGNDIIGVTYSGDGTEVTDGFALWAVDAELSSTNDTMTDNFVGVLTETSPLSISGMALTGGVYGVYGLLAEMSITDSTFTDATYTGLALIAQDETITLTNVSVSGDPTLVVTSDDPTAWPQVNDPLGAVMVATDGSASMTNVQISGYNARGFFAGGYDNAIDLTMKDVTIDNTGRHGFYFGGGTLNAENVSVTNMRMVDDPNEVNQENLETGFQISLWSATVNWTGGEISGSEFIGALAYQSSVTMDGVTFGDNQTYGLWIYSSSASVTNSTITASPSGGGLMNYYSDMVIDGNTFVDNQATITQTYDSWNWKGYGYSGTVTEGSTTLSDPVATFVTWGLKAGDPIYVYNNTGTIGNYYYVASVTSETELEVDTAFEDSGTVTWYAYSIGKAYYTNYNASTDIMSYEASSMVISNNTFTNGSDGITIQSSSGVSIENNTWTDYRGQVLYAYGNTDAPVLSGNTWTGVGANALYCYSSSIEMEDHVISDADATLVEYAYYAEGEEPTVYSYTTTGPAMYLYNCSVSMDNVEITDAHYHAISGSNTSMEMVDVSVSDGSDLTSGSTINLSWDSTAPSLVIAGLKVKNPASGAGLRATNTYTTDSGTTEIEDLEVEGAPEHGIVLAGLSAEMSAVEAKSNGDSGMSISSCDIVLDDYKASENGGYGIEIVNSESNMALLSALELSANASGGAFLEGGTMTLDDSSLTDNTGYGATCDSVVLDSCSNNTVSGNSEGSFDNCDACVAD